DQQFLLASGKYVRSRVAFHCNTQIRPVASRLSEALLSVPFEPFSKNACVVFLAIPTAVVRQLNTFNSNELLNQLVKGGAKPVYAGLTKIVDLVACLSQFLVPGGQFKTIYSITPEQAIAVFKTPLGIFPDLKEFWFHVKHQPIDKLSPYLGTSLQQKKRI